MSAFAELYNYAKDHTAYEAKDIYHLTLYRTNLLSSERKSNFAGDESQEEAPLTVIFWDMSLRVCDFSWALRDE